MFTERSHPASPNRKQQMLARGVVPKSRAVVAAGMLLGAVVGLLWCGDMLTQLIAERMWTDLQRVQVGSWNVADAVEAGQRSAGEILMFAGPLTVTIMLLAASGNLMQGRLMWQPAKIYPDWTRLNPARHLARWISWDGIQDGLWYGAGVVMFTFVGITSLWARRIQLMELAGMPVDQWPGAFGRLLLETIFHLAMAAIVFAIGDYALAWRRWNKSLQQTDQQRRDELRDREGDPALRGRRRQLHGQLTSSGSDLA